jgi:hypothetical protein
MTESNMFKVRHTKERVALNSDAILAGSMEEETCLGWILRNASQREWEYCFTKDTLVVSHSGKKKEYNIKLNKPIATTAGV